MKEVTLSEEGGVLVARLSCEIDHHTARTVREQIDRALSECSARALVMDFSGVGFMDSSGIGLIIGRAEAAGALGRVLRLRAMSPSILRIVRMSGVERIRNVRLDEGEGR